MEQLKNIWFYIKKYKYPLTFVFFMAPWILFIDQTGVMFKRNLNKEINSLKDRKAFYIEDIKKNEKYYQDLLSDPKAKEKLAREEYYMSKANEDVFIIVDKTEN